MTAPSPPALRVGFAGTPPFAASALAALVRAGYTIPLVLSRPDRPKDRGMTLAASPVKALAQSHAIAVMQPASLKAEAARAEIVAQPLDVLVVAAYGLILPRQVLDWPRFGCINIHASLLPRWRGAAPIARAIEAGDNETGVTIMQMDEGLDTGAMIEHRAMAIDARETAGSLHDKLAALGARVLVDVLARLSASGALAAVAQPQEGVTYAHKLAREDARIDWTRDALAIDRAVRAFDPWPAAWTTLAGSALKVWQAHALLDASPGDAPPGSVLRAGAQGIDVACGNSVIRLDEVQASNARRMPAAAFVAGRAIAPHTVLGA